jgi:hypothetical protein
MYGATTGVVGRRRPGRIRVKTMGKHVTIETEYGPITVTRHLRELWDKYGWPTEKTLRRMAATELEIREADGRG